MPKKRFVVPAAPTVPPRPTVKLLLSVPEAAAALSLGQTQVWKLVSSGRLHSCKIGRARRISVASLEAYVAALTAEAA